MDPEAIVTLSGMAVELQEPSDTRMLATGAMPASTSLEPQQLMPGHAPGQSFLEHVTQN